MTSARDRWATRALQLIGLTTLAVAQPVLDLLGRHATFFVAQGATLPGILALVMLLVLGVPVAALGLELLVSAVSKTAGWVIHIAFVAILVAVALTPPIARGLDPGLVGWIGVAAVAALLGGVAYVRFPLVRRFFSWIAVGAPVAAGVFLLATPVSELVLPGSRPAEVPPAGRPAPVIFLLFDELPTHSLLSPDGRIDAARYPGFAALADRSTWYRRATTNGESTQRAVPSMLTGRFLESTAETPTADSYPTNLFDHLEPSMPIYAHEHITRMCRPTVCERVGADPGLRSLLLDAGVVYLHTALPPEVAAERLPTLDGNWAGFAAVSQPKTDGEGLKVDATRQQFIGWVARDNRTDQVARWEEMVTRMRTGNAPALWYLHVALPHLPWKYLPTMQSYDLERRALPGLNGEQWEDSQVLVDHAQQRHLLQLQFTDRLLAALVDRLEREGLFDQALVIATSDHGVSFQSDRSRRFVDEQNLGDLISVPLFVKFPGQREGSIDDRNAELVDVLPTILDVLEIEPAHEIDGSSLRGPDPRRRTKRMYSGRSGRHMYPAGVDGIGEPLPHIDELFGRARPRDDIYAMGPNADLIGTPVDIDQLERIEEQVSLEDPSLFEDVDPDGPFIPAIVRGDLSQDVPMDQPIAVAVKGRIAGVGWAFGNQRRLSVIVSPRFFERGYNDLQVLLVDDESKLRLVPRADQK